MNIVELREALALAHVEIGALKAESERLRARLADCGAYTLSERWLQQEAEIKELRKILAARQADQKAVESHDYWPSTLHMGDCDICGNIQDHPIHSRSPTEAEVEAAAKAMYLRTALKRIADLPDCHIDILLAGHGPRRPPSCGQGEGGTTTS